ncbi:MAG: glycosyltransferase family 39 protein [Planctomycetia bacterium]|nr:glycosyltransferase family 39 protein [Planctomycetia bacterium]
MDGPADAPPALAPGPTPGRAGRWFAALLAIAVPFLAFRLGAKDVWEASEGRPLESAREMRATGEWLVQRTNGEVDLTKPPLYAWAARAAFALGGDHEGVGRVPAVLAALACLGAVFVLARRVAGPRAGFLAGLVLLTTAKFAWQARLAELELPLAAGVLWAFVGLDGALGATDARARRRATLLAGLAFGFAAAVKGPIAFLLVPPAFVAYAVRTGRGRRLLAPWAGAVLALAFVGVAAWPLACGQRDRAWLETLLSFARGDNVGHRRDAFYYVVQYPAFALPWTPLVLLGLAGRGARGLAADAARRARLPVVAFVVAFVLQSALEAKQTHYLVPVVFPMGAVLAGLVLEHALASREGAGARSGPRFGPGLASALPGAAVVLALAAASTDVPAWPDADAFLRGAAVVVGLAVAGAAVALVPVARRTGLRTAAGAIEAAFVAVLVVEAAVLGWVVPGRDPLESSRRFIEAADAAVPPGEPLGWTIFGSHSDYLWYFRDARVARTGLPELLGDGDDATVARVRAYLREGGPRWAIVTGAQADRLRADAEVVLRDDAFQKKRRSVALVRAKGAP